MLQILCSTELVLQMCRIFRVVPTECLHKFVTGYCQFLYFVDCKKPTLILKSNRAQSVCMRLQSNVPAVLPMELPRRLFLKAIIISMNVMYLLDLLMAQFMSNGECNIKSIVFTDAAPSFEVTHPIQVSHA